MKTISFYLAALLTLEAVQKPNFIIIFTDDQGYADLGCYGGQHVDTPYIDQMAAEGARLTNFYVAAPVCTPSRAALMTGCYAQRVDMALGSTFPVLLNSDAKGLHPDEITIAEVLKDAGYKTGMFGKWHLGDQPEFMPTAQGFDEFFGLPYSHDIHPYHQKQSKFKFPPLPLVDGNRVIEEDPNADLFTKRFTERAVDFIKRHKDSPFFLYIPHPMPHVPLHNSPEFMEGIAEEIKAGLQSEQGINYPLREKLFKQNIAEIDWSVGQILETLKKQGIDENTIVLFTSDNGAGRLVKDRSKHCAPLRGSKGSTYEGGMRVPTVIRWPARIPAGKDNAELMTTMDLLPTFSALAGGQTPTDRIIDGQNITTTLTEHQPSPHQALFYTSKSEVIAVRSGQWKLHLGGGSQPKKHSSHPALYNLKSDIGEQNNLIKDHPEIVHRLKSLVVEFQQDLTQNSRPAGFIQNPKNRSLSEN